DRVVEGAAEVADERIERADAGRRPESPSARERRGERSAERQENGGELSPFSPARELAGHRSPKPADHRADSGRERVADDAADDIANPADDRPDEGRGERDARGDRADRDAAKRAVKERRLGSRALERGGDRGRARHDQTGEE